MTTHFSADFTRMTVDEAAGEYGIDAALLKRDIARGRRHGVRSMTVQSDGAAASPFSTADVARA